MYRQKTKYFRSCRSYEDWLKKAKEIGIFQDLLRFYENWLNADGEQLVVHFENLIADPKTSINSIEKYFGWPVSEKVDLLKEKFTRNSNGKGISYSKMLINKFLYPYERVKNKINNILKSERKSKC